jgi:hypothetical protein
MLRGAQTASIFDWFLNYSSRNYETKTAPATNFTASASVKNAVWDGWVEKLSDSSNEILV